ncbi:hypothetical protein [Aeromonas hydrophila]|uniref:hypothetical protein n=1 Tax=Aeromonas hydrophila TaxID=644 RepID=UPI003D25AA95
MSNNTVVLSKGNVQQALLAIRFALREGKTPTFEWRGDGVRRIRAGDVCRIKAVDSDGDIVACTDEWQGTITTNAVLDGEVVLGISVEQMLQYGAAHIESMKKAMHDGLYVFNEKNIFRPGQFIQWKPGMKTMRFPDYGTPVIVIEVLGVPRVLDSESGSAHAPAKLDLVIGMVGENGAFIHYYADSRRFMPHK